MLALPYLFLLCCHAISGEAAAPSWQKYVRGPNSTIVSPQAIWKTAGDVTNAEALIHHNGFATLRRNKTSDPIPSITLDFGINVVGYPQISFAGASSNSPGIKLAFSETKEYLTNISDFTRSDNGDTITPGTDQFAVPSHAHNWTDTNGCLHGTQVCADGLHGFRYMRIALDALASDAPYTSPNGTVQLSAITLDFTAFLGTPDTYTGWFECSDQALTQYWYDSTYTNEMITDHFRFSDVDPREASSPTLRGKLVLFDGAKRDRDPYVGDIAVSGLTAYLTHNASAAAMNILSDLANHQRSDGWIPPASIDDYTLPLFDYPLWWVVTGWQYVLYTGDLDFARTFYPNLVAVLDKWYVSVTDGNHLLSKGLDGTDSYGDYAFLPRTGEVTYYNALYVLGLNYAAAWASSINETASAKNWTARASTVSKAINAHLWDPAVGAYLDTANYTGVAAHAQDGNGIAILAGVANISRAQSSLEYLSSHTAQPYGNAFYDQPVSGVDNATERVYAFISFFELQARFLANRMDSAIEEIDRLYGWMTSHDPMITVWEGIGPGGSKYEQAYTSCAHGWSTGVVSLLSNYVLGVMPTGPGFDTFTVKPYPPTSLTSASGQVPTPHGPVLASWEEEPGSAGFQLNVTSPSGTAGTIMVPAKAGQAVYLDEKKATVKIVDGYVTFENLGSGTHMVKVV